MMTPVKSLWSGRLLVLQAPAAAAFAGIANIACNMPPVHGTFQPARHAFQDSWLRSEGRSLDRCSIKRGGSLRGADQDETSCRPIAHGPMAVCRMPIAI